MQKQWDINMERTPTHLGANSRNDASGTVANTVPDNEETGEALITLAALNRFIS